MPIARRLLQLDPSSKCFAWFRPTQATYSRLRQRRANTILYMAFLYAQHLVNVRILHIAMKIVEE